MNTSVRHSTKQATTSAPGCSLDRRVRRWLCYECAITIHHTVQHPLHGPSIVDGWQAHYVRLPSTRPRTCSGCGWPKREGYREVSPNTEVSSGD